MKMLAITIILMAFTTIQVSGSTLVCPYLSSAVIIEGSTLSDPSCDIVISIMGHLTNSGDFEFREGYEDSVASLKNLSCLNQDKQIYFGMDICNIANSSITSQQLERSVEEAMKWADDTGFNGIHIVFCEFDFQIRDTAEFIMNKVERLSRGLQLPFSFNLPNKSQEFTIGSHLQNAAFIIIRPSIYSGDSVATRYAQASDVIDVADFWIGKGANKSKLIFQVDPTVLVSKNPLELGVPSHACRSATQLQKDDIITWMNENLNKIKRDIDTKMLKGVSVDDLTLDDPSGRCDGHRMLMTRALRRIFN